jgi:hypothetical protein
MTNAAVTIYRMTQEIKQLKQTNAELLEALEYIVGDSVTFLRGTAIEKAKAAIAKAKA